jgi:hypothetical protein
MQAYITKYQAAEADWIKERRRLRSFVYRTENKISELKLLLRMAEDELEAHNGKRPNICHYEKAVKEQPQIRAPSFKTAKRKIMDEVYNKKGKLRGRR